MPNPVIWSNSFCVWCKSLGRMNTIRFSCNFQVCCAFESKNSVSAIVDCVLHWYLSGPTQSIDWSSNQTNKPLRCCVQMSDFPSLIWLWRARWEEEEEELRLKRWCQVDGSSRRLCIAHILSSPAASCHEPEPAWGRGGGARGFTQTWPAEWSTSCGLSWAPTRLRLEDSGDSQVRAMKPPESLKTKFEGV